MYREEVFEYEEQWSRFEAFYISGQMVLVNQNLPKRFGKKNKY